MNSARRLARRPSFRRKQQKQAFIRRGLRAEQLEARTMMAGDLFAEAFRSSHWNVYEPHDVNADGAVSPADALMVIDQLNTSGSRQVGTNLRLPTALGEGEQPVASSSLGSSGFIDVNNDGYLSPADALLVIDDLNAEGEEDPIVQYSFAAFLPGTNTPLASNAIPKGQDFELVVFVDDLRDPPPTNSSFRRGVANGYINIGLSDPSLISVYVNEVQQVAITGSPTGGTFRLSVDGGTNFTDPITWDPFNAEIGVRNDIASKLQSKFGDADAEADFEVSFDPNTNGYTVKFADKFGDQNLTNMVVTTSLVGGGGVTVSEVRPGDRNNAATFDEAFRSDNPTPSGARAFYQDALNADNAGNRWEDVGARYLTTSTNAADYPGLPIRELVRVRVNADNAGTITFSSDFLALQTPDHDTLVYSLGDGSPPPNAPTVPFSQVIAAAPISITITEPISANPDTITLNEDSGAFTFNPITAVFAGGGPDTDNEVPITPLAITAVNGVPTATSAGAAITLPSGSTVFFGTSTTITYTPAANLNGTAVETFTYTITDGTTTDTATVTVNLTAQNDAPINRLGGVNISNSILSGANGATEDTAFALNTAPRLLTVSDIDFAASDVMQVTLAVPPAAGTLSLSTQTGLTFTAGGSGQASMTFTGTLANINAALASLTYNPAGDFNGNAVLTITSNDLGVGGAGGPLSTSTSNSTVTIVVAPANDAPVNTVPGAQDVDENLTLVFSTAEGNRISVGDVDASGGPVDGGRLIVTVTSADNRTLTPAAGSGATITSVSGGIQIRGTISQVNAALDGLSYAAGAGPDTDVLTIVTNDQGNTGSPGALSDTDTVNITINTPLRPRALNDSFTFVEGLGGNTTVELDVLKFNQPALTPGKDLVNELVAGTKPFLVPGSLTSIPASQGTVQIDFKTAAPEDDVIVYTPPSADFFGTVTFQYTMNDTSSPANNGPSTGTVTLIISAANDNPVAANDPISGNETLYTTNEDTLLSVSAANGVLANDFDVDNQQDTDGNGSANVTQSLIAVLVSDAPNGSVTLNQNGSFSYQPDPNFAGPTDTFTYKVQDGAGGESNVATVTIIVNPVNDAPVASNDPLVANAAAYAMAEGTASLSVSAAQGVLANDSDAETPGSLQAILVSQPAVGSGSVALSADGSFTYTPPSTDFNGPVTFTYKANDGSLDSNVATVTINVTPVNDAPVAVDDVNLSVQEDTATNLNITANDTDVDSVTKFIDEPLVDGPDHGTIVVNIDGSVTYTPHANYFGPDSFQYRVRDNAGAVSANVATVTINVQPVNDRPVAINDTPATGVSYTTTEDIDLVAATSVLANDTDAEIGTSQETDLDVASFTQPKDGSNVFRGTLSMNAETGLFTYDPPLNFSGTVTFTYFVTDGSLISTTAATVQITVGADNDAPVAGNDSFTAIKDLVDQTVAVLGNDTDIENDALSVTQVIGVGNVTSGNNGPAVATAHGSVRLVNGSIKYTPAAGYSGPDSFDYRVSDPNGGHDIGTVTVDVIAFIPKLISGVVFIDGDGDGKVFVGEAFTDANSNGVYDNGEAFVDTVGGPRDNNAYDAPEKLIQGVKVRLTGTTRLTATDPGTAIAPVEVTTDVFGRYEFRGDATTQFLGVAPGEYFVTEIQPSYLSDGVESNNVVGSLATRNLASRVGDNKFSVEWDAQQSLVTSHLSGLDFGEVGINAASLADSSGLIQEVLASSGKNGFVLATDLSGNSIWSWCLPGWNNLSKVQLILSSDLASATLRIWDAAHAGDTNATFEMTIYQQPSYNDGTGSPPSGSLARFRVLGRSSSGQYIIRVDGTAADFGCSLAAAAPIADGEGESDLVDGNYAEAADEVFAGEAWA